MVQCDNFGPTDSIKENYCYDDDDDADVDDDDEEWFVFLGPAMAIFEHWQ